MNGRMTWIAACVVVSLAVLYPPQASTQQLSAAQIARFISQDAQLVPLIDPPMDPTVDPPNNFHSISPHIFEPKDTDTMQSALLKNIDYQNAVATHNTNNS